MNNDKSLNHVVENDLTGFISGKSTRIMQLSVYRIPWNDTRTSLVPREIGMT